MRNEDEYFGFASKIRNWTHPLSRRYPWLKYVVAAISIGAFAALMRTTGGWSWVVLIGWFLIGIIWWRVFSRWRDLWWGRRRDLNPIKDWILGLHTIGFIVVSSFTWPFWMAFGEDIFD
ncbi:hypothetical protein HY379_02270 [Candidatus Saccharibacteria bacterium]|nr:hypothetical protein [Candidatus Saccharibacteria bacterium]